MEVAITVPTGIKCKTDDFAPMHGCAVAFTAKPRRQLLILRIAWARCKKCKSSFGLSPPRKTREIWGRPTYNSTAMRGKSDVQSPLPVVAENLIRVQIMGAGCSISCLRLVDRAALKAAPT